MKEPPPPLSQQPIKSPSISKKRRVKKTKRDELTSIATMAGDIISSPSTTSSITTSSTESSSSSDISDVVKDKVDFTLFRWNLPDRILPASERNHILTIDRERMDTIHRTRDRDPFEDLNPKEKTFFQQDENVINLECVLLPIEHGFDLSIGGTHKEPVKRLLDSLKNLGLEPFGGELITMVETPEMRVFRAFIVLHEIPITVSAIPSGTPICILTFSQNLTPDKKVIIQSREYKFST